MAGEMWLRDSTNQISDSLEVSMGGRPSSPPFSSTFARGGPIFIPKLTSRLTSVPDFERAISHELQDLKDELQPESVSDAGDEIDISVDELKVFTDEQLISEAMKEAFQEEGYSSQQGESSTSRQGNNLEKVQELAKIRERQKLDRAGAQLHSLNKKKKPATTSSDNSEGVKSLESIRFPKKIKPLNTREHVNIRDPEVLLCIEVYNSKYPAHKTQEIMVLGQQKLTELRDVIHCMTDAIMKKANQHDSSAYFLIEVNNSAITSWVIGNNLSVLKNTGDSFCNDMRDPSAIDYSKPILDWLNNSKKEAQTKWEYIVYGEMKKNQRALISNQNPPQLPHFRAFEMQSTRFRDLKFHVGARYLYCHQGDCKHDIVIRDMRLVHPEDFKNRAAYPLVGFQSKSRVQKCSVCQVFKATRMTVDDVWAGENPCYFCDNCYTLLYCDENGDLRDRELRYSHVVHDIIQDMN